MPEQVAPELMVMLPLPATMFSLKVMVGEIVTAMPVAPAVGVKLERVGAVVSMVMDSAAEVVEVFPAAS